MNFEKSFSLTFVFLAVHAAADLNCNVPGYCVGGIILTSEVVSHKCFGKQDGIEFFCRIIN